MGRYLIGLCLSLLSSVVLAALDLQIKVDTDAASPEFGWVYVDGIDRDSLAALRQQDLKHGDWRKLFSVQVQTDAQVGEPVRMPQVAGRYEILETGLRFIPQFAPSAGLAYRVDVQIGGRSARHVEVTFLPHEEPDSVTQVETVYPSAAQIPENTLRLYVHFSRPMSRGQVIDNIDLLDEQGRVIEGAFIVGPMGELWDQDQRRLTLLLDPGRIKQGVAPNRVLGPALRSGGSRTLRISANFKDAKGIKLGTEFLKRYAIESAVREAIQPAQWRIDVPEIGASSPLRLGFTRSLDSAMLKHAIRIYGLDGKALAGRVTLSAYEREWHFTPIKPWSGNEHVIKVETQLEDVSGNNLLAPLDVKITNQTVENERLSKPEYMAIQFQPGKQNTSFTADKRGSL